MSDFDDSVNKIIALLERSKKVHEDRGDRERAVEQARLAQDLRAYQREFHRLEELLKPIPVYEGEDLSDLPKELRAELSVSKTDELEDQLATVINAAGREADIDMILIYLFRKFNVVQTRRFLQNKLYRMVQKGLLYSVPGRKGVYSTLKPDEPNETFVDTPQLGGKQVSSSSTMDDDEVPF
ncbi:hypothetical protein [Hyphomonas sp.]|uniref:hypothetical protein n=1 Tax=Hyphomonas sp. TaxID=87 RepID=UPI001BCC9068|nr:hypothetical protein [Hyphomonas sp.]